MQVSLEPYNKHTTCDNGAKKYVVLNQTFATFHQKLKYKTKYKI